MNQHPPRMPQGMREPYEGLAQHIGRSVSLDQAAEILRVSRRTIYNRIRDGRLQTIRTIGGSQRVLVESMQRMYDRRSPHVNRPPVQS